MSATFSDDDVGKSVENGNGEEVGTVIAVESEIAHVRPDPSAVESIKSSLGWEGVVEKTVTLEWTSVQERTVDTVRLEGALPTSNAPATGSRPERDDVSDRGRGASVDPTELGDYDSGFSARPDEGSDQRTDAAVVPDEDASRTDAAVNSDAVRETEPIDQEPTTEDSEDE